MHSTHGAVMHPEARMYDYYQLLIPRVGTREIQHDPTTRAEAAERRRRDGCLRPEQRTRGRRDGKGRA